MLTDIRLCYNDFMRDTKSIILVVVIVILIGVAGFFTYLIANGEDPLVLLNSQASEGDPLLTNLDPNATPTPEFTSTSPSPAVSITTTVTSSASLLPSASPMPTITSLPETGGGVIYVTATPTPVTQLPDAGSNDFIYPVIFGGLLLVSIAFLF